MASTYQRRIKIYNGTDYDEFHPLTDASVVNMSDGTTVENKLKMYTTTNSGNAYSVTIPNLASLTDGLNIRVKFNVASTGAITLNINSLGAKSVKDYFGNSVTNVRANLPANLVYESTSSSFILLGKGGGGDATADHLLVGDTATVDSGPIAGTMPNKGAITITPSGSAQTIPSGYHNGQGKVSAVTVPVANVLSGTTIAGQAGTMPNKGAVTITPGTADKAIEKGYHNGSGKVKGEPNLKAENIPEGMSMFGIAGVLEKKQDISPFLLGDAANHRKEIISPLASLNECWGTNYTDPHTLYKYDEGGNVIQTIEGTGDDYFICVSKNYILKTLKNGLGLLDKNGTLLKTISKTGARHGVIDEKNNRIVFYSGGLNVYTLDNISYLASNDSLEKAMIFIVNKDTVIVTNYYSSSSSTSDYYSAVVDKNNSINITLNRWNNFII